MSEDVDLPAARRFVEATARVLDRHRLAALLDGAPAGPVLAALRPYRNEDGGFGHALEPDVRGPHSETVPTLTALDVLAEVGALGDPMVEDAARWVATVAQDDGGVPFVLPQSADHPHAPWMVASPGGSHLTFGFASVLGTTGHASAWLDAATAWCWAQVEAGEPLQGYTVKYALRFLDAAPDAERAAAAIERLRPALRDDGSLPVPGGTADEQITSLALSPHPGARSRALFPAAGVAAALDDLVAGQRDDGGWTFDFLAWTPAQEVEWRGAVTVEALATLAAHGRVRTAAGAPTDRPAPAPPGGSAPHWRR